MFSLFLDVGPECWLSIYWQKVFYKGNTAVIVVRTNKMSSCVLQCVTAKVISAGHFNRIKHLQSEDRELNCNFSPGEKEPARVHFICLKISLIANKVY